MNEKDRPQPAPRPHRTPLSRSASVRIVLGYAICAATWILLSDKIAGLVFSSAQDLAVVSTLKGWVFVLVTALGLSALLRRHAEAEAPAPPAAADLRGRDSEPGLSGILVPFAIVALALGAAVTIGTMRVIERDRENATERLKAIAALRASQVEWWRQERVADVEFLETSTHLADLGRQLLAGSAEARKTMASRLGQFIHYQAYHGVRVITPDGRELAATGTNLTAGSGPLQETIAAVLETGHAAFTPLFRLTPHDPAVYFDAVVPIPVQEGEQKIFAVLETDARRYLFDMLAGWPVHSDSGETLLARRADGRLEFFGRRRRHGDEAPPVVNLATGRFPAVAALGDQSRLGAALEGPDLDGGSVVTVTREIPGTDWLLIAKIDSDELLKNARNEALWVVLSGALLALALVAGAYFLHQRRVLNMQRALARHQQARLNALGLLGQIADASTDAIFAKDLAGRYLLLNRGAGRAVGKAPETVIGQDDTALFPPAEAALVRENDRLVMAGNKVTTFEEKFSGPDGEQFYLATKGPLHDSSGRVVGMYGISRDVTANKHAEAALRASEETYRALFRNLLHAYTYCRIVYEDERPIDFEFLLVNDAFSRLTGLADVTGRRASAIVPGLWTSDYPLLELLARVASTGEPERGEHYVNAVQEWLSISAYSPRRGEFVALFYVVSERKRMEASLRESEARLARAQAIARVGNWQLESPAGAVSLSDEGCRVFGLVPGTVSSFPQLLASVHQDDAARVGEACDAALAGKAFDIEFRRIVDGEFKWLRMIGEAAGEEDGRAATGFGTVQDITRAKQYDHELAMQNHVLELVAAGAPLEEVLSTLVRELEAGHTDLHASVLLMQGDGAHLVHAAGASLPEAYVQGLGRVPVAEGAGSCGTAAKRGTPVFVADITTDALWQNHRELALASGMRACWSTPIPGAPGEVLGTFAVYRQEPGLPNDHEQRLMATATHAASISLVRHREEIARRETEAKLRVFIENAPAAIAMFDRDMRYLIASRRWLQDYRVDDSTIVGRSHYEVFPEIPRHWREVHMRCLAGEIARGEEPFTRLDGRVDWQKWEARPWSTHQGEIGGIIIMSEDVTSGKLAEQHLRDSEERFRAFMDHAPAVAWIKDERGRYVYVNGTWERSFHMRLDDIRGKTDAEIWPQAVGEDFAASDRRVLDEGHPVLTTQEVELPGRSRSYWLTSKFSFRLHTGLSAVAGIAVDITETREAQNAVEESKSRYERIAATVPGVLYDFSGDGTDGRFVYVSPRAREFVELEPEEIVANPAAIRSMLEPEDLKRVFEVDVPSGVATGLFQTEVRVTTPSGKRKWLRLLARHDPALVTWSGIVLDTTEQHAAVEAVRKLSLAVEQSPNSIVITDLDGSIQYVNEAFTRVSGYSQQEALGQNPRILKSGRTPPEVYIELWNTIARGEVWKGDLYNCRKDGSEYLESAIIAPIREPDGRVTHYLAIKEDITQQQRTAEELQRYRLHLEELVVQRTTELAAAKDAAEVASRAKSSFIANMSHEIRTPMNAIIGLTYLLQQESGDPAQHEKLGKISVAAHHLQQVIDQVLDLSKIEAGKFELDDVEFDLDTVIEDVCGLVAEDARTKDLELVASTDRLPRFLRGDPVRLAQIMLNYLGNAVKFTPQGTIRLHGYALEDRESHVLVRFDVTDTGIGIEPAQIQRLFQAFEQADSSTTRRFGGTGLGLAVNRRFAALMGGEVGAHGRPGGGSTFWFTARLGKTPRSAEPRPNTGIEARRVLIVDDLPDARTALAETLRGLGLDSFAVDTAADAHNAVERAAAIGAAYDFVLVDAEIAPAGGAELARRILDSGHEPQPRCLLLARTGDGHLADAARAAGCAGIVSKPLTSAKLYDALYRALHGTIGLHTEKALSWTHSLIRREHGTARVLLVEDNEINRQVAMELLASVGLAVDCAGDGAESLRLATANAYDLILMDVQMPGMDGLEATRQLRAMPRYEKTPILAMTASAYADDRAACLEADMDDHISKPVNPELLYATLLRWLPPSRSIDLPPAGSAGSTLVERLADLPEFDAPRGLWQVGGREEVYERLLKDFVANYGSAAYPEFAHEIASRDVAALRLHAHSLKGSAGTLGAVAVQRRAESVENLLRAGEFGPEVEQEAGLLIAELAALVELLDRRLPAAAGSLKPPRGADLGETLAQLEALLEAGDFNAGLRYHQDWAPLLRELLGDARGAFEAALLQFDYDTALDLLRAQRAGKGPAAA